MSASHGMNHFYQLLIPVIIPKITAEYGLSNFIAGVLLSCFSLSYALLQTPTGYISKVIGRKKLLISGFVITSISFLAIGFVDNVVLFAALFLLAGVGGSFYHPIGMPFLAEFYKENLGQASGFHQTGGALGSFVAPLVTGAVALVFDWRLTVAVLSIPGIVLSIILWLLVAESKPPKEDSMQTKQRISLKLYGSSIIFIVAAMVSILGLRGIDSFANQYFVYGRGIANFVEAAFLFSMLKVAGLFSSPLCGRLSDRFGRRKVLFILILIQSISIYALTMVSLDILLVPCLVFGFASFGSLTITDAFLTEITPKANMETIFGLHYTVSFLTSAIIPPILGNIIDLYGFNVGIAVLSAVIPFSIPIFLQIKKKDLFIQVK
jgi:MFS family permease